MAEHPSFEEYCAEDDIARPNGRRRSPRTCTCSAVASRTGTSRSSWLNPVIQGLSDAHERMDRMTTETINVFHDSGLISVVIGVPEEFATDERLREAFGRGAGDGIARLMETFDPGLTVKPAE